MKFIFYLFFLALSLAGGIYFFSLSFIEEAIYGPAWEYRMFGACVFSIPVAVSYLIGKGIWKGRKKESYIFHGSLVFVLISALVICELWAKENTPSWPAVALHGVEPGSGQTAWGRILSRNPQATGINTWGQRDNERKKKTSPGKRRIVFIGDSLLEQSSDTPVNLLVEQRLGDEFEVINLGVSGASPEEYYWRTKNVALEIGAQHVVVFLNLENDLQLSHRMLNLKGIWNSGLHPKLVGAFMEQEQRRLFAPAPFQSVFGTVTPGINYGLSKNEYKAVSQWIIGDLNEREKGQLNFFQSGIYKNFSENLLQFYNEAAQGRNLQIGDLGTRDFAGLYQVIQTPDKGLFRSSLLEKALGSVKSDSATPFNKELVYHTYSWLSAMRKLCISRRVKFTVVLVPQGVSVDDRMRETYLPIADLRKVQENVPRMADLLKDLLQKRNTELVDLRQYFQGKRGTYLNFDNHWSTLGNELAAEAVSGHLLQFYKNR